MPLIIRGVMVCVQGLSTILLGTVMSFGALTVMSQNVIQGGDMEKASESLWSVSTLNSGETNSSEYEFGYTDDAPSDGVAGNLRFSVTNTGEGGAHIMFYQKVTLEGGKQYEADMAVKTLQGMNNSWFEVYIGSEPVEGEDYGSGQTLLGGFKWSEWEAGCSDEFDAVLSSGGCIETEGNTFTAEGEGEVEMFLAFKAGIWAAEATIEFVVDEISLTKLGSVSANETEMTSVNVYPNPVSDVLNILSDMEIASASIINAIGQEVMQVEATNVVNVSDLTNGFYLIKVKNIDGTSSISKFQKK